LEEAAMTILPGWLNLDSLSIVRLAALLLSIVLCVYLLQVPRKSLATLFLAGAFLGAFLFNAASFFEFAGAYYWQPRNLRTVFVDLFVDIGPSFAMVCLLLFAYHFPRFRSAERREFRIVFALSIALNAGVLGLNVYSNFILQWQYSDARLWNIYWLVFYCSLGIQFLGAITLLFRKSLRLSRRGSRSYLDRILRPKGQDAQAARALGAILLLPVVAIAASLAMTYGVLPFSVATYLTWIGLLLFYLGFIVTYLNHSADPLTLQLKLLGVTLVLILSTMGLVALFVGETSAKDYPAPPLPASHSTISFTPNGMRSYDVRTAKESFDPDLGPKVDMVYGRPFAAALDFDFPFFAGRYRTIHILNGPMVYLGENARENGWGGYNPQPAVAPLIMNLDPSRGGGVHLKSIADSVTVTWFRMPEWEAENENTVQLVLRANGVIEMSFEVLTPVHGPSIVQLYDYAAASTTGRDPAPGGRPVSFPPRLTGIHPGGWSAPLEPISFTGGLPYSGGRSAVVFQSYEAGFAHYLNARIGVLAALTVIASLLVLVLIPLMLRGSLFTPLRLLSRGMRKVEAGDLGAAIRVQSRDEIGSLARSFNRMVEGLKERFELTKYVSSGTIEAVKTSQEPRRAYRTLLFTDVRGFTSYTEQRRPEQVVKVLNHLLESQSEVIQRYGGDIDKFAGDEIVAVFSGVAAARSACAAALGITRLFWRRAAEFERLTVGAGIATGPVIQGMIGSIRRADFTVIGDSVNLASRLCGIAKGMQIVVSDATMKEVERDYLFRGPFSVRVKGKSEPQKVWVLMGPTA
jgi:class 3 adenylate cyclase